MKRFFSSVMLVAAAATAFFSCQKQEVIAPETEQEVMLTFASEKPAFDDETKTEWTGETIQWSKGDKVSIAYTVNGIWQNASGDASGDAKLYKSEELKAAAETAQFNVSTSFKGTTEGTHVFYGVYPAPSETAFSEAPVATLAVPAIQTPGASSFDGAADLMTGVSVEEYTSLPAGETISMEWTRLVAHANITLKALNGVTEGETVSSIKLTAQEGANLVGSQKVNLLTNEVECNNNESNVIDLMGGNLSVSAEGNIEFWACFLPTTLTSLKVEVETNKASYAREITGIEKTFKQNARNTLSIKMNEATRVAKEEESWVLVKPADGLTEGTYVLVISTDTKTGALVSTNGSSSAPTFNTSVSVSDNTLNGVTEAMQFDLSGTAGNYKLAVTGQTTNYLYTTSANNGVRVGTNANNVWTITQHESNADAFVFKCNETNRYLGVYNNQDWRCYDQLSKYTLKGASEIYLYKKQSGPVVPDTTPSVKLETEELELTAEESEGTIWVEAKNIESIEVRALPEAGSQEECDWLVADYDVENSCVTYLAAANETEEPRKAYIEVYCLDADANEIVAGVNVIQDGVAAEPAGPQVVTVAEFLNKEVSTEVWYELTGTISNIQNTQYGNFDLTDNSGTIYVYGLKENENAGKTTFSNLGLKEGDVVTLIGNRAEYSNSPQVGNAYYVSHLTSALAPEITVADNMVSISAASGATIYYTVDGTVPTTNSAMYVSPFAIEEDTEVKAIAVEVNKPVSAVSSQMCLYEDPNAGKVETVDATLSFANKAQRTSYSTSQQVWEQNGITLTNDKASSTSNVADYANPARFYKSSKITIDAPGNITKIEFTCNSSSYATALKSSITSGTVTASGSVVTVIPSTSAASFVIASLTGGQVRMNSLKVTYEK